MTYALDRQAMVDQVLNGDGKVADVPESPLSWNYPKSKVPTFDYNPKKAKQLLKEAGWEDHDGDGYLDKDGKNSHLKLKRIKAIKFVKI